MDKHGEVYMYAQCLGEHPHKHPPPSQEYPRGQNSPARPERREAARQVNSAVGTAATATATGSTEVAEKATKTVDEENVENSVKEGEIAEEAFTDQIVSEDTEEVTIAKGQKGQMLMMKFVQMKNTMMKQIRMQP